MDYNGDVCLLQPELLQLNEVSSLAIKSNSFVADNLFQQWLSLPDSTALVILIIRSSVSITIDVSFDCFSLLSIAC